MYCAQVELHISTISSPKPLKKLFNSNAQIRALHYYLNAKKQKKNYNHSFKAFCIILTADYLLDVLWGQRIKLIHVASNSELRENQWNDLLFFEIEILGHQNIHFLMRN